MCVYNGHRVSRAEFIRLKNLEKELKNYFLQDKPVQHGYDYRDWPIIRPTADGKDITIDMVHWEFIPPFVHDEIELKEYRKRQMWLNAKSENLFVNDQGKRSMWADAAINRRCLVLSSGFYEHRHLPMIGKKNQVLKLTEKVPYHISLRNSPGYFFMAGIWQNWTNQSRGLSADTFAIVTTEANSLMRQIHNSKNRMPCILTEDLAYEWIQPGLTKERILEIAKFQIPSELMIANTVDKQFKFKDNPAEEVIYPNVPALDYAT